MKNTKRILLLMVAVCLFVSENIAQSKKQSLAVIRKDARSYIVYSDGSKEELPYFVLETEGAYEGLSRARIMLPTEELIFAYLDKDGNIIMRPEELPKNYEGRFLPLVNNHVKFIGYDIDSEREMMCLFDKKGKRVFPQDFDEMSDVGTNDWVFVHNENHHGFYDLSFKKKLNLPDSLFGYYTGFSDGISLVENKDYRMGAINEKGEIILPLIHDIYSLNLREGILFLSEDDKVSLINKKGKTFATIEGASLDENYMWGFRNGLFPLLTSSGGAILINKKGEQKAVLPDLKYILEFDGKIITCVSEDEKHLIYDTTGKLLRTYDYNHMGGFVDGYSYFFGNERGGFVDINGKEILLDWDVLWDIRNGSMFF